MQLDMIAESIPTRINVSMTKMELDLFFVDSFYFSSIVFRGAVKKCCFTVECEFQDLGSRIGSNH